MMVMTGHVGALGDHGCGNGEAGGIIIFIPLGKSFYDYRNKDCDKHKEDQGKHYPEHSEAEREVHTAHDNTSLIKNDLPNLPP
jgi:hypothetical protein